MKKLQQTLIIGALLLSPLAITQVAGAQQQEGVASCPVGYKEIMGTGPDSKNIISCEATFDCKVTNTNHIEVLNTSEQDAFNEEVKNLKNTEGGDAQSGSATNVNNVDFAFEVTNPTGGEGEKACVATATVAPTPVKPASQPEPVPAPAVKAAPKLATTAGDNTVAIVAGILGATTVTLASLKTASWLRRR